VILFPARQRKAASVPEKPRTVSIPPDSVVLVIDDEETVRSFAGNVLLRAGVKVLSAADGRAGVEVFREHSDNISVVILDLLMPVMGGEKAIALLRDINPNVPVILSSGFDVSEAAREFSEIKPAGFLQKPYTPERLIEAVEGTLQRVKRAGSNTEQYG
jgi:DNA-binding NtrC family response regulator